MSRLLFVEQCSNDRIVNIGLVKPVEAGVDECGQCFAVDCFHCSFDAFVTNADGILRDRAGFKAGHDGIQLLLARVVANDHKLAFHAQFGGRIDDADDGAFVSAEEALDVRVGLNDRLGQVGRFQVIASAILGINNGDIRILFCNSVSKALDAVNTGAAGLGMRNDRNLTGTNDQLAHLFSR